MPRSDSLSFLDAAIRVLREAGQPLHADEICDRALREGLLATHGRTPRATMAARLAVEVSRRGAEARVRRAAPNTFALAAQGQAEPPRELPRTRAQRSRMNTSLWPLPGGAEHYGDTLREMLRHIRDESAAGRRVDFDGLADWLASRYRLSGETTPRSYAWLTVQIGVAEQRTGGGLVLTSEGSAFLASGEGTIIGRLLANRIAGVAEALSMLYPNRALETADFHSRWSEEFGWTRMWQTYYRLNWLRSASLVRKTSGNLYSLTPDGRALAQELDLTEPEPETEQAVPEMPTLQSMIADQRASVRAELRQRLMQMSPSQFEHFAGSLLEALGFSEIEVTRRSGDGGIDGQGTMRVGIVTVRAAFQCKRWTANVGRPEIQRFRGAIMGQFDQGVFVTTSTFSAPAQRESIQRGGVPIILVDGDRIADAMIQHGVGVTRRPLELLTVDESFFAAGEEQG